MEKILRRLTNELEALAQQGLYRRPVLRDNSNRDFINLSSNDYLGLASSKFAKKALIASIKKNQVGAGASRLVTGNFKSITDAEREFAQFFRYEDCLFFSSGFQANTGLISSLFSSDDCVFFDKHVHSSMVFGLEGSPATIKSFKHNDLEHLDKRLEACNVAGQKVVLTESCFSMDGDCPDFEALARLKKKHNLFVIVDEAHSFGLLGEKGCGLAGDVADIAVGTFGKSYGHYGAFLLLPTHIKEYLINTSRPLIYTTALPPYFGDFALRLLRKSATMEKERATTLELAAYLKKRLQSEGFSVAGDAHILAIEIGNEARAAEISKQLLDAGFMAGAIRFPTVPLNKAIIRVSLNCGLKRTQIEKFCDYLAQYIRDI
ncbi:MAG: 8-amino-7-oxononanoate synthase [Spirochaetales bacterium]|nr:8-amino-7-oxononanoate synthase [Spirochaetales bacterium]